MSDQVSDQVSGAGFCPPDRNCPACPRLVGYRTQNRTKYPGKHNAPVPPFGNLSASLLIVGLAPGLQGANFTGRPFTGDWAGDLLYDTLLSFGYATGIYAEHAGDGLRLHGCRITNAVRCVPPENKPTPTEIKNCLPYLRAEMAAMPNLRAILCLGLVSHNAVTKLLGLKAAQAKFAHGAVHQAGSMRIYDSYHCSRYNTNTRRLTPEMFRAVFAAIKTEEKH